MNDIWIFILVIAIILISLCISLIDIKIEVLQECVIIRYTNIFTGVRNEKIFSRKKVN